MRTLKFLVFGLLIASFGCANIMGNSSSSSAPQTPPPSSEQSSFYYDFNDIRVPEEMEIQTDKSSLTPVAGGKSGLMRFKGRVEPISMFEYFSNTMPKDGWTLLTYQKYQRFFLVFTKDTRVAVISMGEDPIYYTWLEIWVTPRVAGGSSPAYSTGAPAMDAYPSSYTSPSAPSSVGTERTLSQ